MCQTLRDIMESPVGSVMRPVLHLFAFYPLLLIVPTVVLLFVWGVAMSDYDAAHQFWNESPRTGILAGAFTTIVFGEVMLALYLLDTHRRADAKSTEGWLAPVPRWGYWAAWGVLLLAAIAPAVTRSGDPGSAYWFPLGVVGMAAVFGLIRWQLPILFVRPELFGLIVVGLLGLAHGLLFSAHALWPGVYFWWIPSAASLLGLLGFAFGLLAVFSWVAGRTPWLYPVLIGLFVVPFVIPACQTEYRVPNMADAAAGGESYYDHPARLIDYDQLRTRPNDWVIPDDEALNAWHARMADEHGKPGPLVVVTVSGGASASALYVAEMLFAIEEAYPGTSDRIRLISGASGGMLGAAYFVTQFRPGTPLAELRGKYSAAVKAYRNGGSVDSLNEVEQAYTTAVRDARASARERLGADFLGPLVQKWVHLDMPLSARTWATTNDRGSALEQCWDRHLGGALAVPFYDLRAEERAGQIPSLVFTPMMVEDGRQLVISNLDLGYMVDTDNDTGPGGEKLLSYGGVEFFRLFPAAREFRLGTAVRMNASFPFFSPAVALPTDPVRHVVDAGYYDNYGSTVATRWLDHNADWFAKNDVEVLMLRLYCWDLGEERVSVVTNREVYEYARGHTDRPDPTDTRDPEAEAKRREDLREQWRKNPPADPVRTNPGLFSVSAPMTGLFSSRRSNMLARADENIDRLRERYGDPGDRGVFSHYRLSSRADPSLNWVLSPTDQEKIRADVDQAVGLFRAANTGFAKSLDADRSDAAVAADVPPEKREVGEGVAEALKVAGTGAGLDRIVPGPGGAAVVREVAGRHPTESVVTGRPEYQQADPGAKEAIKARAGLADRLGAEKFRRPE